MSAIREWLNGAQEYEAGRLLYEQHGRNPVLKRTLSHGPSAYNRSALREELTKLAQAGVVASPAPARPAPARPGPAPAPVVARPAPLATQPDAVQALLLDLEKQWKPKYKEASYLQSQLEHAKDNQERCTWSHRILDLMEEVEKLWAAGAYVREHGQLPPVAVVASPPALDLTDPAAVLKRRNNLRAQISKQKRNAERAEEVAAWKLEVEMLDKVLKTFEK